MARAQFWRLNPRLPCYPNHLSQGLPKFRYYLDHQRTIGTGPHSCGNSQECFSNDSPSLSIEIATRRRYASPTLEGPPKGSTRSVAENRRITCMYEGGPRIGLR